MNLPQFSRPRSGLHRHSHRPRGIVLIMVLVTIVILALSAYTFTALMQTEEQAARLITRRIQSKYLVDSGVDYARLYLARTDDEIREIGGRWDNTDQFKAIPVAASVTDIANLGSFTIVSSSLDDDANPEGFRYGLVDESSRINLNVLPFYDDPTTPDISRTMLLALPNMTEEIADAILDWLDKDDNARDFGVETSYYQSQSPAYEAKNGPLDSLDELLLIKDVTPTLLFGLDTNRNGILDDSEANTGDVSSTEANMHLGWANYITLYSSESNLNSDGLPRININDDDLEQLYDDLKSRFDDNWANFIIYWRTTTEEPPSPLPEGSSFTTANTVPIDWDQAVSSVRKFESILDLFEAQLVAQNQDGETVYLNSPLQLATLSLTLPVAMQELTHFEGVSIPGRINIMQAPRIVLNSIPGLTEEQIDLIIERREYELDEPNTIDILRLHPTWIWAEAIPLNIVDIETMKSTLPYICTGGDVYRAEIVGFFPDGVGTSRAEAVIDTTAATPRLLFWRDKSHLESGYSIDALGSQLLR